ncbi:CLUMA_CG008194, isoform A [Clunio marinus]|uniref:CLUMA_CG008194, isoform A n=1 Tax=Clunio marinus TaxID=568069 RepID=A0A1J1I6W8_9DIPT|nr:CLUMA_CG008194, isoform A [Clunio marinus]
MSEIKANISIPFPFCVQDLNDFHTFFNSIHYQLSLCVCIFGSITNILNLVVLTRKDLRTHINFILAGLAISDFLVMVIYIPYAVDYAFNINTKLERFTYSYALYVLIHATLSQTAHTISIFLTIFLALWRYVAVCHPHKKNFFMRKTFHIIAFSYIYSVFVNIPIYMSLKIKEFKVFDNSSTTEMTNETKTLYKVWPSEFIEHHEKAYLWVYSVIIKLLPCIALTYFSVQLIRALYEAKRRKAKLTGNVSMKLLSKKKQADRTTKMLVAVLLLFLITEFPQAIMGLLSALLHESFYHYCYQKLGDLMDFLALLNSSINFILYCTMSRQFRETFANIFLPKCLKQRISPERLIEMDSRGQVETIQETQTQMTQL